VNYLTLFAAGVVQYCKVKTLCSIRAEMSDGQRREGRNSDTAAGNFAVSAPTISLPKGDGAIHSMGEKFAANPVTGTGSMSVLIATSFERSGFGPQPSLSYDSGQRALRLRLVPLHSGHYPQDRQGPAAILRCRGVRCLHSLRGRRPGAGSAVGRHAVRRRHDLPGLPDPSPPAH
jgi:Salmonella virulence plasmid 65kDa B protein